MSVQRLMLWTTESSFSTFLWTFWHGVYNIHDWNHTSQREHILFMLATAIHLHPRSFGVPPGSMLGPVQYVLYTSHVAKLVEALDLCVHLYAADSLTPNCLFTGHHAHPQPSKPLTSDPRIPIKSPQTNNFSPESIPDTSPSCIARNSSLSLSLLHCPSRLRSIHKYQVEHEFPTITFPANNLSLALLTSSTFSIHLSATNNHNMNRFPSTHPKQFVSPNLLASSPLHLISWRQQKSRCPLSNVHDLDIPPFQRTHIHRPDPQWDKASLISMHSHDNSFQINTE